MHAWCTVSASTFDSEGFVRTAYVVHYTQAGRPSAPPAAAHEGRTFAPSGSTPPPVVATIPRGNDIGCSGRRRLAARSALPVDQTACASRRQ